MEESVTVTIKSCISLILGVYFDKLLDDLFQADQSLLKNVKNAL
jgi:hypothetical protein